MKRKYNSSTCFIAVNIGDRVKEIEGKKREGVVTNIKLTPGIKGKGLVALVKVKLDAGGFVTCTSNWLTAVENQEYDECYPSAM